MIWNEPLSVYRVSASSASRKLTNLDTFIKHNANFSRITYEDFITTYKAINGSGFEYIIEKYINYQKIVMKLYNLNDIKTTLKDVLNAVNLLKPDTPKEMILITYLFYFIFRLLF